MERWIMLLRGINVGGHNRVAMVTLSLLMDELGFDAVVSYIQSGNVAFDAAKPPDPSRLVERIAETFNVEVQVVVLRRSLVTIATFLTRFRSTAGPRTFCTPTGLVDPGSRSVWSSEPST